MPDSIRKEPKSPLEIMVDDSMQDLIDCVENEGGEVKQLVVMVYAEGVGEQDTTTAGHGFRNPEEVFIFLMTECMKIARQIGVDMKFGLYPPPSEDPMDYLNQEEQA